MSQTGITSLTAELKRTFDNPSYKPPLLPVVALELLRLASRTDVEIEDVVRVLERDQMMAGAVIRLAGSSIYAGRGPARSLRDAVLRLGVRNVRDTVFQQALKRAAFDVPEYRETIERVNRHGTATAYLTRVVCRYARVNEDQAFLCGLLHDIGFSALLLAVANRRAGTPPPPLPGIWVDIVGLHEQASKVVTKLWALPQELSAVVSGHHHEHSAYSSRLAAVVTIADHLALRFDAHIVGPPDDKGVPMPACPIDLRAVEESRSVLLLGDAALDRITDDAGPLMAAVLSD